MKNLKLILTLVAIVFVSLISTANVHVATVFSDNMVLQRNINLKVWGAADPGEKLILSFNGQKLKTKTDKNGDWLVVLNPMKAGGPFTMTIHGIVQRVASDLGMEMTQLS